MFELLSGIGQILAGLFQLAVTICIQVPLLVLNLGFGIISSCCAFLSIGWIVVLVFIVLAII